MAAPAQTLSPLPPGVTRPPSEDELPYDDDEPMESEQHREQMNLLIDLLRAHLSDREDVCVGGNMGIYYSELQTRTNTFKAPDVFVALDAEDRLRKSWVMWQEGKLPDLVIELLSESTEKNDRGPKKQIYERVWRLPEYYLFDPDTGVIEGYRLDSGRRELVGFLPDGEGRLVSELLGCSFGVWHGVHHGREARWMRVWDAQGALVPTADERAEDERRRAEDERRRAEDERRRAEDERRRVEELQARLAAYEARFGKLEG